MKQEDLDKTLRDIYAKVPKEWRQGVVTTKSANPTILKVVEEALAMPDFPTEKKKQIQELKDAGYFNKQEYKEDPAIVKKIDNFVNREIKKAVKAGRLPNKKKLAELQKLWKEQKEISLKS